MYYGGSANVPGAPGNPGFFPSTGYSPLVAGGLSLKDLLPNAQSDIPTQHPNQYLKPGSKPSLKELFPARPGLNTDNPADWKTVPAANLAFLDNTADSSLIAGGPSFNIPQGEGPLGKRSGEQLQRLYQGGTQQNQQLNEELIKRGLMPGAGPQLPLAQGMPGMTPMGNAGFYAGPQLGQSVPPGFQNKIVS